MQLNGKAFDGRGTWNHDGVLTSIDPYIYLLSWERERESFRTEAARLCVCQSLVVSRKIRTR